MCGKIYIKIATKPIACIASAQYLVIKMGKSGYCAILITRKPLYEMMTRIYTIVQNI